MNSFVELLVINFLLEQRVPIFISRQTLDEVNVPDRVQLKGYDGTGGLYWLRDMHYAGNLDETRQFTDNEVTDWPICGSFDSPECVT